MRCLYRLRRKMKLERPSIFKVDHGQGVRTYGKQRLAEQFQFRYLPTLQFDNYVVEQWIKAKCLWAYKRGYISKLALWLGKLHGAQLDAHYLPEMLIKWVGPDIGYGVFTEKPIARWEFVGEYAGILKRRNLLFRNVNDYCFMYPREWVTCKAFTIDGEKEGNATRFINHSDKNPNLESIAVFHEGVFRIIFRAIKDIGPGEELRYDYGGFYWNQRRKVS